MMFLKFYHKESNMLFAYFQLDMCKALSVCYNFFGFISHYALLALTLDRFIFIKRPLHYPLIMTKNRTWMMFLGVPFLALIHAVLGFFAFQVQLFGSLV